VYTTKVEVKYYIHLQLISTIVATVVAHDKIGAYALLLFDPAMGVLTPPAPPLFI
jgi:hypothetical protein